MEIVAVGIVCLVVLAALGVPALRRGVSAVPAPRLSPGYAPNLLARAGFPATAHNVAVLHDHLGQLFLDAADAELGPEAADTLRTRCAASRGGVPVAGGSSRRWPQRVLDELAAAGVPDLGRLVARCQERLVSTTGTGAGLFGGSVYAPLPRASAPAVEAVPAPRVAGERLAPEVAA